MLYTCHVHACIIIVCMYVHICLTALVFVIFVVKSVQMDRPPTMLLDVCLYMFKKLLRCYKIIIIFIVSICFV